MRLKPHGYICDLINEVKTPWLHVIIKLDLCPPPVASTFASTCSLDLPTPVASTF